MADYANRVTVSIAEISRLTFMDQLNDESEAIVVADIAMHPEMLRALFKMIGDTITKYDQTIAHSKHSNQINKNLS